MGVLYGLGEQLALADPTADACVSLGKGLYVRKQRCQCFASVPDNLAKEEVEALDGRRALVQCVDLRVTDVLLERVILEVARATEDLQRICEKCVRPFRANALDQRKQQIV